MYHNFHMFVAQYWHKGFIGLCTYFQYVLSSLEIIHQPLFLWSTWCLFKFFLVVVLNCSFSLCYVVSKDFDNHNFYGFFLVIILSPLPFASYLLDFIWYDSLLSMWSLACWVLSQCISCLWFMVSIGYLFWVAYVFILSGHWAP